MVIALRGNDMGQAATEARAHRVLAGFGIRAVNVLAVVGLLAVLIYFFSSGD